MNFLHSEQQFPSKIRTSQKDYLSIISEKGAIAIAAYLNGEYVGNSVGYKLRNIDLHLHPGLEKYRHYREAAYFFNIIVIKKFRGRGLGKELFHNFVAEVKKHGFTLLVGHFRNNGSASIMKSLGAGELARFEDWEGTGEQYLLLELAIA